MNKQDLITIRPMIEADTNFILATFLRGLYHGESPFSEIPRNIFFHNYNKTINNLLAKETTEVLVACLKDDPEIILGYSVLTTSLEAVHFIFVKKSWRGIGIAKSLLPINTKFVTHVTKTGLAISKRKGLLFNPFLF